MKTFKMSKKFGVQIVAFNNSDYIEAVINSLIPFVDKIVVSIGEKSWRGNVKPDGKVEEIVKKYESEKLKLVKGSWKTEEEQRNHALDELAECDYVLIIDDDELWASEYIYNIKDFAISHPGYTVFNANWNTRFKKINWRVDPREPFKPTVMVANIRGVRFEKMRLIGTSEQATAILVPDRLVMIEHFSYVRKEDKKILEKIKIFSHSNEIINGPEWWYNNVFLEASLESKYLHPTVPECYDHLTEDDLHPEIKAYLKKYSKISL